MTTTYLLFDTCVWLSLAQDADALPMLQALKGHSDSGTVVLLVPTIVTDEFERHRDKIIDKHNERLGTWVKHARAASILLSGSEAEEMRRLADKAAKQIPEKASTVAHALKMASELLRHRESIRIVPKDIHAKRVAERALAKRAPFHRNKNSVADALLMECFRDWVASDKGSGKSVFVTENTSDYCDEKKKSDIHAHYQELFADKNVAFSINAAEVIEEIGPFEHSAAVKERYATATSIPPELCPNGGVHSFTEGQGAYLRSQYGGLTWQLFCNKCRARFDTGDSWD